MRCLLISDIHSNLAALEAVFADAPADLPIWCLGDLVGYGPNPNECIELLRERNVKCVIGNHDWATIDQTSLEDFNTEAKAAVLWTQAQLKPENLAYLRKLPISLVEREYTLVHGSPRKPVWEYILHPTAASLNFAYFNTTYCLVGHTHIPVIFRLDQADGKAQCQVEQLVEPGMYFLGDQRAIINPGSVGQPRDGDARASYAILDTETNTLDYRRISYDLIKTQTLMHQANLPGRLIARLSYGW